MSIQESVARAQSSFKEQPWRLFASQIAILVRTEVRRNLFTRRRIWVYLLAFIPVLIFITHNIFSVYHRDPANIEDDTEVLAGFVQLYYLRLGIFFACMGIFTWLFRGEMVQRTLHYQFLAPVRKEVLVIGKFLAGAIISPSTWRGNSASALISTVCAWYRSSWASSRPRSCSYTDRHRPCRSRTRR